LEVTNPAPSRYTRASEAAETPSTPEASTDLFFSFTLTNVVSVVIRLFLSLFSCFCETVSYAVSYGRSVKKKALFSIEKRATFAIKVRAIDAVVRKFYSLKSKYISRKKRCQEFFQKFFQKFSSEFSYF
jgi:hypothetical protein